MNAPWTLHTLASELLDVLPRLGRVMGRHARSVDQEKATLMRIGTLFFLSERPLTVSMLAQKRGVSLQAASTLVQGLVEQGWVVRVPDPDDRRQSLLKITPEGAMRAQVAKDQMSTYLAQHLDGFEPEEIEAGRVFVEALKRVLLPVANDLLPDFPPPPDEMYDDMSGE